MQVFEWAHLYVWQALIMLDVLVVWLVWVRTLPARGVDPRTAGGTSRAGVAPDGRRDRPSARGPLGAFIARVLRVAAGDVRRLVFRGAGAPVAGGVPRRARRAFRAWPTSSSGVEQARAELTFATTLKPGRRCAGRRDRRRRRSRCCTRSDCRSYAALVLAATEPGWPRRLAVGYAVLMPFVAWGALADFLKNVAITMRPQIASQTGSSPGSARRSRSPTSSAR